MRLKRFAAEPDLRPDSCGSSGLYDPPMGVSRGIAARPIFDVVCVQRDSQDGGERPGANGKELHIWLRHARACRTGEAGHCRHVRVEGWSQPAPRPRELQACGVSASACLLTCLVRGAGACLSASLPSLETGRRKTRVPRHSRYNYRSGCMSTSCAERGASAWR